MSYPEITLHDLEDPVLYGPEVDSVTVLQTHISYVVLTGRYAYKIKKPVDFGFLDFSTLEKRKYYCEEEIRLNRRLCPDIYLEIMSLTKKNGELRINGDGDIVEYAVKMKEFPQEKIMTNLLKQEAVTPDIIDDICTILIKFYQSKEQPQERTMYGDMDTVKQNTDENFEQTRQVVDVTIPENVYNYIKITTELFYQKRGDVFERRKKQDKIRDCHGDLHSGNIVILDDKICIFDCIEFNKRFRYTDVASDIGFLAMDLDFLNHFYLSSLLIKRYVEESTDAGIFEVLNFYKSYRAYVRGKVLGFRLNDSNLREEEKREILETTQRYFSLSHYYTQLFSLDVKDKGPVVFVVCGLTGTGKSTIARKLSVDYHAHQINTDVVRKEMEGLKKYEKHHDPFDRGLYTPERRDRVYQLVFEKAEGLLNQGENVVLDATFQKKEHRNQAKKLAERAAARFLIIQCICPDEIVKQRLIERAKSKSISDGRWEIYQEQKDVFEPFTTREKPLQMDTSNESYTYRLTMFKTIVARVNDGAYR
jgi:hypothetical protein